MWGRNISNASYKVYTRLAAYRGGGVLFGIYFTQSHKTAYTFIIVTVFAFIITASPFVIYMLSTHSLDDFFIIYVVNNLLSYFGSHGSSYQMSDPVRIVYFAMANILRNPHAFATFVAIPFLFVKPFSVGKLQFLYKNLALPCNIFMLLLAIIISLSCWGVHPYYHIYGAVMIIIPATCIMCRWEAAPSKVVLIIMAMLICSFVVRQNGMWNKRSYMHRGKSSYIEFDKELCDIPYPKLMYLDGLDSGFGIHAQALPACPQWIKLSAYDKDYYAEKQLQAVRLRKADYVFYAPNPTNGSFYERELQKNGYICIKTLSSTVGEALGVWKKTQ